MSIRQSLLNLKLPSLVTGQVVNKRKRLRHLYLKHRGRCHKCNILTKIYAPGTNDTKLDRGLESTEVLQEHRKLICYQCAIGDPKSNLSFRTKLQVESRKQNRFIRDSLLSLRFNTIFSESKNRASQLRRAYISQRGKCHYCSKYCYVDPCTIRQGTRTPGNLATYDHILASAYGGKTSHDNCVMCCAACNTEKGCIPYEVFIGLLEAKASPKEIKSVRTALEIAHMRSKRESKTMFLLMVKSGFTEHVGVFESMSTLKSFMDQQIEDEQWDPNWSYVVVELGGLNTMSYDVKSVENVQESYKLLAAE